LDHEYIDSVQYNIYEHDSRIITTAISPDSRLLCTSSRSFIAIRDVPTGKLLFRKKIKGVPKYCRFSGDGQFLVAVSDSGMQRFDCKNKFASKLINNDLFAWTYPSRNGRFILTGTANSLYSSISLWDLEKYKSIADLNVLSVRDTFVTMDVNGLNKLITGTAPYGFPTHQVANNYLGVDVSNDGRYLRVYDLVWNVFHNEKTALVEYNQLRRSDISSDDKYVLTQQQGGMVGLWDIEQNKQVQYYQTRADNIKIAAISPDGKKFLVNGADNIIKIAESGTGHTLHILKGHRDDIFTAVFNKDGTTILTNSFDSTAKLWDVVTGVLLQDIPGRYPATNPVYFSGTGKLVFPEPMYDTVSYVDLNR
jgi:WD40 repeat protein